MNKQEFKQAYRAARINFIGDIPKDQMMNVLHCKHKKDVCDSIGNKYRNALQVKTIKTSRSNLLNGLFA